MDYPKHGYWDERYSKQGKETVGCCSFSKEEFGLKTEKARNILRRFLLKNISMTKRFLDFGVGWGRMVTVLEPFCMEIFGIDIVDWAVRQARLNYPRGKFHVYNGKDIPFPSEYFGGILSWTVLQHIPEDRIDGICKEMMRVMAPMANLILYENVSVWHKNSDHIWFRTVNDYWSLFDPLEIKALEIVKGADGNDEDHALTILKKS